jgi:hypothetical protein
MGARGGTGILAMAAALAAASPVVAQEASPAPHDVAVAIVDIGADKLYSEDPNVRFVDLTPPVREGYSRASGNVSSYEHGRFVAQSFVDEYRRLDPSARITVYTVNPFIQKGVTGGMMFSRSMVQQAIPKLKEADVRIAVTTFGTANQQAGEKVVDDFRAAGMTLFAAAPNDRKDEGVWPAADPRVIAVADGTSSDADFFKARGWSKWVDFTANGQYHKGTIDIQGSSFATPKVAAYGVHYAARHPGAATDEIRDAIRSAGETTRTLGVDHVRVATPAMTGRFLAATTARSDTRTSETDRSLSQMHATLVASRGASR